MTQAPSPLSVAKLRHDLAQFSYLQRLGALGTEFTPIVKRYRQIADQLAASKISRREQLTLAEQIHIGAVYNRTVYHFTSYNRRPDLIRRHLGSVKASPRYIPYRQNRAIIFNSDLFHGTAACRFRDDYENRRINVTMLYGHRRNDAFRRPPPVPERTTADTEPYAAWRSAALRRSRR
jgi:hypothetical protein